jgi:hypothetical protein
MMPKQSKSVITGSLLLKKKAISAHGQSFEPIRAS